MVRKNNLFKSYGLAIRIKWFFLVSILVIILDQVTKGLAHYFSFDKLTVIPGVLWLTTVFNHGAAFGILSGKSFILGLINILVVLVIIYYNFKNKLNPSLYLPLAFITGGALGNAIDRILFSSVVDFLDLGRWPVFNIADSFIIIGFAWLIISEFFFKDKVMS